MAKVTVQETSPSSSLSGKGASYPIPRRSSKMGGTLGKKIKLDTNHFAIQFKDPNIVIFHYDVAIDPDKPAVHMR